jgi:hypothetical protein
VTKHERLAASFYAYRRLSHEDPNERLTAFFRDWRAISTSVSRPGVRSIQIGRLAGVFADLRDPLQLSRADGRHLNPWTAAGLWRSEVRNASALASLWRPEVSGEAARLFLNAFLRCVEKRSGCPLPSANELARGYLVRTEHCLAGERTERVDLTIEGRNFVIGVEVKIDAAEGDAQLQRYTRSLIDRAQARRSKPYLIFLAPYPHRGAIDGDCPVPIVDATWKDIQAAADILESEGAGAGFVPELIDRFACHVARF